MTIDYSVSWLLYSTLWLSIDDAILVFFK